MNLAYFLPLGGSLDSLRRTGQDKRFLEGELSYYLQKFDKIYIFDYSNIKYETHDERIVQICNSSDFHRFVYALIFPILHRRIIKSCVVIRVSHLTGMIAGIVSKFLYKKRVVFNYAYNYADFAKGEKKYVRSVLLYFLSSLSFYFSDGVIVASKNFINKISEKNRKKIIWIPNGVNKKKFVVDNFNIVPSISKTIHETCPYDILFVGRLTEQKNIFNLLEAVKIVDNKKIKLTIVGQGNIKEKISNLIKKYKINGEIIDKVNNEELPVYYNDSDLFILPSRAEGSSKVLLEAMSCGSLCLVSKISENTEIIKDGQNGFVCGFSAGEIADRIKYIMQLADTDRIKKNARNTIEKEYSMDIVMEKEVYFVNKYAI